jgi:hypothetical protein
MSKVAMITGRDGEDSQAIKSQTDGQRYPTYFRPQRQQAAGMQKNKLRDGQVMPYLFLETGRRCEYSKSRKQSN